MNLPASNPETADPAMPEPAEIRDPPLRGSTIAEPVADLIAATGLLDPATLGRVRASAGRGSIARAIVAEGVGSSETIARTIARRQHLQLVDLSKSGIASEAAALIPLNVLERVVALPYALEEGRLKVAVADPQNVQGIDELRLATELQLDISIASRDDILSEIRRMSRISHAFDTVAVGEDDFGEIDTPEEQGLDADDGISDGPVVRLVNSIIFRAAEDRASDVHFEPQEDALVVRVRIDGVLQEAQRIPRRMAPGVMTRMKVLAKLDIAQRRKPQDGRISLSAKTAGRMLDIRVATLPTVEGESIVLRLLDKSQRPPTLEELGLSDEMRARFDSIIALPTGALLVTGPTGSGKSTTLYAALSAISRPEINVITVEDPVEYRLGGVSQVQINVKAGLTFATALRSILRSDPDVVMVGEIRDGETAKISIEAALTGHFVLSTLHTNDAPSVLTRLNEMGVEPFLTGSAVSAVLAQRLARKLCVHCAERYTPTFEDLMKSRAHPELAAEADEMLLLRKRGCARCNNTGYRGRIGIFQLLEMTTTLEELAVSKASRDEIERAAMSEGMHSLWDDGFDKVVAGVTSLEELARVVV